MTYRSDKSDGPPAGTETLDPLECLARVLVHIPDQGHVTKRYDGWYANRARGTRDKAAPALVPAPRRAPTEAARRRAALLQQIFDVDPLACPTCRGPMRIIACITQASVLDQILTHLCTRAAHAGARSPPATRASASRGTARAPARPPRPRPYREYACPRPRSPAETFGARDRPTASSPESVLTLGHPPGPQAERPAMPTGAVAGAPSPAHRGSRGRGPGPVLSAPRLIFRAA